MSRDPSPASIMGRPVILGLIVLALTWLTGSPYLLLALLPVAVWAWYRWDTAVNFPPEDFAELQGESREDVVEERAALPATVVREDLEEPDVDADGTQRNPWPTYDEVARDPVRKPEQQAIPLSPSSPPSSPPAPGGWPGYPSAP